MDAQSTLESRLKQGTIGTAIDQRGTMLLQTNRLIKVPSFYSWLYSGTIQGGNDLRKALNVIMLTHNGCMDVCMDTILIRTFIDEIGFPL